MILARQQGIRWRLAALYTSIFATGLLVFCGLLFQYFQRVQIQAFDTTLYNFAVDISSNLEMDFVGRLFVVNSSTTEAGKLFPFPLGSSFLEIRDSRGKVLLHSRSLKDKNLPLDANVMKRISQEKAIFENIKASSLGLSYSSPDLRLLTYWASHKDWREPLVLQIAVPLDLPRQERSDLLLFFALGIPIFLLVSSFAGVWMSKRALAPVHDIILKAKDITGVEKLKERLPVPPAHDEIRELSETFNNMLDRLDKAFASQDRFISNASHQLKTPLTILKGELEILKKQAVKTEVATGLESASAEIDRLITLVQDLLLLARLEAGQDHMTFHTVRVDEVLMRVVSRVQKLAKNKNVRLTTHLSSESLGSELDVEVLGDEELLDSMIENFLENAVKYAPEASVVELELKSCPYHVELRIRDYGPGIPVELRQKIFERFQRVQPSNIIPGSGLGLSIASEIASLHKVEIRLDGAEGGGTIVVLKLPRV